MSSLSIWHWTQTHLGRTMKEKNWLLSRIYNMKTKNSLQYENQKGFGLLKPNTDIFSLICDTVKKNYKHRRTWHEISFFQEIQECWFQATTHAVHWKETQVCFWGIQGRCEAAAHLGAVQSLGVADCCAARRDWSCPWRGGAGGWKAWQQVTQSQQVAPCPDGCRDPLSPAFAVSAVLLLQRGAWEEAREKGCGLSVSHRLRHGK